MAKLNKYEVKLGSLTVNGKKCSKPSVELIGNEGILINCIDEKKGVYTIQVPSDRNLGKCFEFLVSCDECKTCDQTKITKCLCDSVDNCGDCETCSDGFCISKCKPEEQCHEGRCVTCRSDEDCPANQECIGGQCQCPAGTILIDGVCKDCSSNADCDSCEICGPLGCESKDCGSGQCDPTTGNCEECVNSGGCGVNEVCVDGNCVCSDGYIKVAGICQPKPQCSFDSDCGDCQDCVQGRCSERACPIGLVCIGDKCVPECDCDNANCNSGYHCSGGGGDKCGCLECGGSCEEGCSDPCFCSGGICIANPCGNKPCNDGTECAYGCGCYNGVCTPCATIPCNGLESGCDAGALGCECVNGNCVDSDDACGNSPCETYHDCALGCTCEGGVCTSCDNYTCPEGCAGKDGCICVNGNCEGDSDTDASNGDCADTLTLEKDEENCTLTGTLAKDYCCSCPPLTINIQGSLSGGLWNFTSELRKGGYDGLSADSNPRLDNTGDINIAENDTPLGGLVEVRKNVTYDIYTVDAEGNRRREGQTTKLASTDSSTFGSSSAQTDVGNVVGDQIGLEINSNGKLLVVSQVEFVFTSKSNIPFSNECNYAPKEIGRQVIRSQAEYSNLQQEVATTLTSSDCRLPLFKWYKSGESAPFRKLYIDGSGTYVDKLTAFDEGLENCKTYTLDVDCTCKDPVSEYIDFCNPSPEGVSIEFIDSSGCKACAKEVKFIVPRSCQLNVDSKTRNQLLVDGAIVYDAIVSSSTFNYTHSQGEVIKSAEWKLICEDGNEICNKNALNDTSEPDWPTSLECASNGEVSLNGDTVAVGRLNVPDYPNCSSVNIVDSFGTQLLPGGVYDYDLQLSQSQNLAITVTLPCGGQFTYTLNIPNQIECGISATISDPCNCGEVKVINGDVFFLERINVTSFTLNDTYTTRQINGIYDQSGNILSSLPLQSTNDPERLLAVFCHKKDVGYNWVGESDSTGITYRIGNSCDCNSSGCGLNATANYTPSFCGADVSVVVNATGGYGLYSYSIDGSPFTNNPTKLINVSSPKTIQYIVRDEMGCEHLGTLALNCEFSPPVPVNPVPVPVNPVPVPVNPVPVPVNPVPVPVNPVPVPVNPVPVPVNPVPVPVNPVPVPVSPTCGGTPYAPSSTLACCADSVLYNPQSQECCSNGTTCNSIGCCNTPVPVPVNPVPVPVSPTCGGTPYAPSSTLACCADSVLYNPQSQECCSNGTTCNSIGCCNTPVPVPVNPVPVPVNPVPVPVNPVPVPVNPVPVPVNPVPVPVNPVPVPVNPVPVPVNPVPVPVNPVPVPVNPVPVPVNPVPVPVNPVPVPVNPVPVPVNPVPVPVCTPFDATCCDNDGGNCTGADPCGGCPPSFPILDDPGVCCDNSNPSCCTGAVTCEQGFVCNSSQCVCVGL